MRRTLAAITSATCAALTVMLVWAATTMGGEFAVAACQSDKLNNASTAFDVFATRGMRIRRACNPEEPGEQGLVTANVQRRGVVKREARSIATITAPPGTVITWLRWHGQMGRADCRFGVELYAVLANGSPKLIDRERRTPRELRTGRCRQSSRPLLERLASTKQKRVIEAQFDPAGATQIVQRVICQGRTVCLSSGKNFIRTLEADLRITDVQPPVAAISSGTPLADGAWVGGEQPLRYDARDNVGVQEASAITSRGDSGADGRACFMATETAFSRLAPCPNGAGQMTVKTRQADEGTQHVVVQARDAAGNLGNSPPVTARVDNTPPSQVPVSVDGGERWRNRNDFALSWVNPAENDRAPIVAATYKLCSAAGGNCSQAERPEASIAGLPVQVPGPGEWRARCGAATRRATRTPARRRYPSRCVTTPRRRSSRSSRRPRRIRRRWRCRSPMACRAWRAGRSRSAVQARTRGRRSRRRRSAAA